MVVVGKTKAGFCRVLGLPRPPRAWKGLFLLSASGQLVVLQDTAQRPPALCSSQFSKTKCFSVLHRVSKGVLCGPH